MDTGIAYNGITEGLKRIFLDRFDISIENYSEEDKEKHLLGGDIGLTPRDMIYLFFDIEKNFGITIPQEDIAEGKLCSINNIIGIIHKELHK